MPAYKNRPRMPDDTPLWRHLNLSGVLETIQTRRLRLTRVDRFQDPFEGSVPKQTIEDQNVLFIGAESRRHMLNRIAAHHGDLPAIDPPDEDSWTLIARLRRARTRSAHASCWSAGDESEALWRLYCNDGMPGVGVALRTSLGPLEASVSGHDLFVSPITYRLYHNGPAFTDEMDHLLHKRLGFAAERELRLLKFDDAQFRLLVPKGGSPPELPDHIYVDWAPADVISEIVISPYADADYEKRALDAITAIEPGLGDRIVLSELHERRYPANF
jgi:hypothetical protein